MSDIFGIFHRDGRPLKHSSLETMRAAIASVGENVCQYWTGVPVGLGEIFPKASLMPESSNPVSSIGVPCNFAIIAAGRVDNRIELGHQLGVSPSELTGLTDRELLMRSYHAWQEDAPIRIYGDWLLAAWHPSEQRLFLARDHHGISALYYYADKEVFAFASSRQALLALNLARIELDEYYLAQVLVTWSACNGESTIHKPIRRLPPAHCLAVTPERIAVKRYWQLEETTELLLPRKSDYLDAFRDIFDEAVRCRLRANSPIGVTLSGGLDSGSVATTAASLLRAKGCRLNAFTSVPLSNPGSFVGDRFGDELPYAISTASAAGNIDLHLIDAVAITPIAAIRQAVRIHDEPIHAAGNYFWILALEKTAYDMGCRVLLTGQEGNPGVSWTGSPLSHPFADQIRLLGWQKWNQLMRRETKEWFKQVVSLEIVNRIRRYRAEKQQWWRNSAINPDFASRLRLLEQRMDDPNELPPRTPLAQRFRILKPGRSITGEFHAQMGAALGLEIRDPTADARVLAFTFSVPDHIYMDPETGMDRWLIREAMKGRLPDEVRLNRKRGRQSSDIVPRLRACAGEVETALDELGQGPASAYLDVPYMRRVWQLIQTDDTQESYTKSITILTRGIMTGLFVNRFNTERAT